MKYYTRTTDTQNIKILAKILLGVIEDKEMDKEYIKSILTQIYKNGFYAIEKKEGEENEMNTAEPIYCNGCPQAYICYGADVGHCEQYKERMKKEILNDNNRG